MLTDLYPLLAPLLLAASAWLLAKALGLDQYLTRWVRTLDPDEEGW